jgi:hypothetical protein
MNERPAKELVLIAALTVLELSPVFSDPIATCNFAVEQWGTQLDRIKEWCNAPIHNKGHKIAYVGHDIVVIEHEDGTLCQVMFVGTANIQQEPPDDYTIALTN